MLVHLLEAIAAAFDGHGIPYMIIGGQAVLVYGEPRLTKDIDITLGVGPDQLDEILAIARAQGWSILPQDPAEFVHRTMVLPCSDPSTGLRIDLVFSFSEYERQALNRIENVRVGSAQVSFASLEDLVIHKIIAARPRDLEDVRGILAKNPGYDAAYIRSWLEEFDRSLGESYVRTFNELAH